MYRLIVPAVFAASLLAGCATTSRHDVREARRDVREAQLYGGRGDVREAKRELRKKKRDYHRDNYR